MKALRVSACHLLNRSARVSLMRKDADQQNANLPGIEGMFHLSDRQLALTFAQMLKSFLHFPVKANGIF